MKYNIVIEKTFKFAIRIVKLYNYLKDNHEFTLSTQLLKSGTSIGANVEEAMGGQSKNDFISKLSIAYKEARETRYWILLLYEGKFIPKGLKYSFLHDIEEILKIIGTIQKTIKARNS